MRVSLQPVNGFPSLTCPVLFVFTVGASLFPLASTWAADNIGVKLPSQATVVLEHLHTCNYKNVGVLNFRVQNGDAPPSFNVGPLNIIAARSLENALIEQNANGKLKNEKGEVLPPLGIIREAGAVAAKHKERVSYLKPEGVDKLFAYTYPLAWGKQTKDAEVRADAFVTGLVKINPNLKETTVVIEVLDRESKNRLEVTHFKVHMERTILADICQSFALAPDKVRKAGGIFDEPNTLAEAVNPRTADRNAGIVKLEIRYSGQVQTHSPHPTRPDAEKVDTPQQNQEVVFVLRNTSQTHKAGIVFAVNGYNTLYREDVLQPKESLSRWILEPGKSMVIRGFYSKGDKGYSPFKVLSDVDSAKMEELDPHPGLGSITMIVFTEGDEAKATAKKDLSSLRTSAPFGDEKPKTAEEASKMAGKTFKQPLRSAGLISFSDKEIPTRLSDDKLKNPQFQAQRIIWFYERTK